MDEEEEEMQEENQEDVGERGGEGTGREIIEIVYHNSGLACVGDITGGAEHTAREILLLSICVITPAAPI